MSPQGQKGTKAPHGTATRYNVHGCRCNACRKAWAVYFSAKRREWRAKKRQAAAAVDGCT